MVNCAIFSKFFSNRNSSTDLVALAGRAFNGSQMILNFFKFIFKKLTEKMNVTHYYKKKLTYITTVSKVEKSSKRVGNKGGSRGFSCHQVYLICLVN